MGVLAQPDKELAVALGLPHSDVELAKDRLEHVRHGLGNMVEGALGGLFDAPSAVQLDFDAPIQSVDLSRIDGRGDETVAMVLACVSSWSQSAIDQPGGVRAVVRDEVWRSMRIPAMVRKIDSDLRLSRSQGTIQMLATPPPLGLRAGRQRRQRGGRNRGQPHRVLRHPRPARAGPGPLEMTRDAIGLTDGECEHVASWSAEHKGYALWKIGRETSHIVSTRLTERELFHTNERMIV